MICFLYFSKFVIYLIFYDPQEIMVINCNIVIVLIMICILYFSKFVIYLIFFFMVDHKGDNGDKVDLLR
jgi:hypothetical protein